LAGLKRETDFVHRRKEAGDRRFKDKAPAELTKISRLRWSYSAYAQDLANREQAFRQRAQAYLAFSRLHPYQYPEERDRWPTSREPRARRAATGMGSRR
jgi:hypothetical protein